MQPNIDIQRIQARQTALLRVLDSLCRRHGIQYFLAYGSLLGAIRHQGPIPWDDDLDILVPRADWIRLQSLCREHLSDLCFVQTPLTDPAYRKPFVPCKLRDRFSLFIEEEAAYHQGNYIDIFPLDIVEPDRLAAWRAAKKRIARLSSLYLCKNRKDPSLSPLRRILRFVLQSLASCIHPRHLLRRVDARVRAFQHLPDSGLPPAFDPQAFAPGALAAVGLEMVEADLFPLDAVFPLRTASYAGMQLPIPQNPDLLLTCWYGNYLEIPPAENRPVHCLHYEEKPWPSRSTDGKETRQ